MTKSPSGQMSASLTSTLPPPSRMRRVAHGSGTQAPSSAPAWNAASVSALSWGVMLTSPPPLVSVVKPSSSSHARRATSWVLPSDGVASVVPARSAGVSMPSRTTSEAPPDVVPATIRRAAPSDLAYPLIAGFGPMKLASIAPENSASMTSVPELKVDVSSEAVEPSASWNSPVSTPMIAGAWVTLGKYPSRSVTSETGASEPAGAVSVPACGVVSSAAVSTEASAGVASEEESSSSLPHAAAPAASNALRARARGSRVRGFRMDDESTMWISIPQRGNPTNFVTNSRRVRFDARIPACPPHPSRPTARPERLARERSRSNAPSQCSSASPSQSGRSG